MELQVIKVKDCANLLKVSDKTARKYLNDIREYYGITTVTLHHLKTYLKVS